MSQRARAPLSLAIIEAFVLLNLGTVAVFGIATTLLKLAAGPGGIKIGDLRFGWAMDVDAELFPGRPIPGLTGSGDAPVAVSAARTVTVWFNAASRDEWLVYQLPQLLLALLMFTGLLLLLRIVRTARAGDVFVPVNARRIMAIAVLVLVGGTVVEVVRFAAEDWLLSTSPVRDAVAARFDFSVTPIWLGLLLLFFAEVFRRGVRLRADVEGLV